MRVPRRALEGAWRTAKRLTLGRALLLAAAVSILVAGDLLYGDDAALFDGIDRLERVAGGRLHIAKRRQDLLMALDHINPFVGWRRVAASGLGVFDLTFSRSDAAHFEAVARASLAKGTIDDAANDWRSAQLAHDGTEVPVRVKIHGTARDHFAYPRKSFAVKAEDQVSRFNLLRGGHQLFYVFNYELMRRLKVFDTASEIAVVRINGIPQGLYVIEEKLDAALLRKNGITPGTVLKTRPIWDNQFTRWHESPYDLTVYNIETETTPPSDAASARPLANRSALLSEESARNAVAVAALQRFFEAVRSGDIASARSMIDRDFLARTEAYRMVINQNHYILGDNARFIYEFSTGKLKFFYPRPEDWPIRLAEGFGREPALRGTFEGQFVQSPDTTGGVHESELMARLLRDDAIRQDRNRALYELLASKDAILGLYRELQDLYGPAIAGDSAAADISTREAEARVRLGLETLAHNIRVLEGYLGYAKTFAVVEVHDRRLRVRVSSDSNTPVAFERFTIHFDESTQARELTVREADGGANGAALGTPTLHRGILNLGPALGGQRFNNRLGDRLRYEVAERTFAVGGFEAIGSVRGVDLGAINAVSGAPIESANVNVVVSDLRSFTEHEQHRPEAAAVPNSLGAPADGRDRRCSSARPCSTAVTSP